MSFAETLQAPPASQRAQSVVRAADPQDRASVAQPQSPLYSTRPQEADPSVGVQPLSAHIGAEISGVDLREPLAPGQIAAIAQALHRWKVVFFRDQHLDHAQHVQFARQFGELTVGHPVFGHVEGHPEIYSVSKNRHMDRQKGQTDRRPWTGWHTDVTAAVNPPTASILRGVTIPPYGGDTQWTNLAVAYSTLSAPLQAFVETLWGEHRFTPPEGNSATQLFIEKVTQASLVSLHPLVRVHPVTREKLLFVSPSFLKAIAGVTPRESRVLLDLLFEHVTRQEFTVRFKWQPGSIAFWDNRATAHLAPNDIFDLDFDRQLYRVTLVGEVPQNVQGEASRALAGDPVLACHSAAY
ncbi:MAG: TauD/TfdA family dioxygenase [Haliea sp.]|nr:MAG: TauD/TfdA family dioxygenase [Haliea sp.]